MVLSLILVYEDEHPRTITYLHTKIGNVPNHSSLVNGGIIIEIAIEFAGPDKLFFSYK